MEELWSKKIPPTIKDVNDKLKNIPENHKQEALNSILYNLVINYSTSENKKIEPLIKELIHMGAKIPQEFETTILLTTYNTPSIFKELIVTVKKVDINVLESIISGSNSQGADIEMVKMVIPLLSKKEITIKKNLDPEIIKLLEKNFKIIEKKSQEPIYLYKDDSNPFNLDFSSPFIMDNYKWDTAERYIMYKLYENTAKGEAIKNAKTLKEAQEIFLLKPLGQPKNTKEMIHAKNIGNIANSDFNKKNLSEKVNLFYNALYEKFNQHALLKNKLLATDSEIIDKDIYSLGYEGNLLGNTLMRIRANFRGDKEFTINKNNNLSIKKYVRGFYIVRGDPDDEIAAKLRTLSTYKTKSGKTVHGKLVFNLLGGPGWLISESKVKEAKTLVHSTQPVFEQLNRFGRKWIKHKLQVFLEMIKNYVKISKRTRIEADDVMLIIKDIYPCGGFLKEIEGEPDKNFYKTFSKQDIDISDSAVKILWDFLANMIQVGFEDVTEIKEFNDKVEYYDGLLINKKIPLIKGLNERETIFVKAFLKVYNVLKGIPSIKNPSIDSIKLLFMDQIDQIKDEYDKIIGSNKKSEEESELQLFKERFKIQNPHLETILKALEGASIDKKNKLLVLVALDYFLKQKELDLDLKLNKQLSSLI